MEQREIAREIIENYNGRRLRIMEVCGTHTHEIFRLGVRNVLNENVELISGPGCPVCVTAVGYIDMALQLALEKGVTICTFGDLIRVPGSEMSMADARAQGAQIKIVYSQTDALKYAKENPGTDVVFLSVGFETTTPGAALTVKQAYDEGIKNYSILTANKTMPAAYQVLKDSVDAYLYPGHVHAIIGTGECERLAAEEGVSGVCAGFTANELLTAIAVIIKKSQEGKAYFVNAYPRVVKAEGNPAAVKLVNEVMEPCDSTWRGLGVIKGSGMRLREKYAAYDAQKKYDIPETEGRPNPACRCGEVLQGHCKPSDCPLYGKVCTPEHPIGACMVSNEGACSAYYQYSGI